MDLKKVAVLLRSLAAELDPGLEDHKAEPPTPEPPDKKVTLADLQEAAYQLLSSGRREELKEILAGLGLKSLSSAPEEAYTSLMEKLKEAKA